MIYRIVTLLFNLALVCAFGVVLGLIYMSDQLPSVESLRDIQLQTPLMVYTTDGKLIGQFGEKRRIPITLDEVPPLMLDAFIATEDRRFYDHSGVDFRGLMRAAHHVLREGNKAQGGSTITMQLARNMFLSPQKTYLRKINEILLALQIEKEFNKKEIFSLYLNKIYLGQRAYGIAAAAQVYYGKKLSELSIAEMAMIAGLPKAPSTINPITNPERARERRTHVLESMLQERFITQAEFDDAVKEPLAAYYHSPAIDLPAPYVAEMVRKALYSQMGDDAYTMGLKVYTTLDSRLQEAANDALTSGLLDYDRRQGYRGPIMEVTLKDNMSVDEQLATIHSIANMGPLLVGVVTRVTQSSAEVLLKEGKTITVEWPGLAWARRDFGNFVYGSRPRVVSDIFGPGAIIYVRELKDGNYVLSQQPKTEGALVALSPYDGGILALAGGFDFYSNHYNMVTQAQRQPGSNLKPFIYSAALENGYTAASIINDSPIVVNDVSEEALWRPQNDNRTFLGPTRLRMGLVRSRNLVSIRILDGMGIRPTINYLKRFGFDSSTMTEGLSLALGTNLVTPMQLATGYATFANGGFLVKPFVIDHIKDHEDKTVYVATPHFACEPCTPEWIKEQFDEPLDKFVSADRVISPQNAYIMNDILRDVVKRGTGQGALKLGREDIGGKTGTTNDKKDGWFSGFGGGIVTTTWIGYDTPQSLGEFAAQSALPTWVKFMSVALDNRPEVFLPEPPGIITVRVNNKTGLLVGFDEPTGELELFYEGTEPSFTSPAPNTVQDSIMNSESPDNTLF